MTPGRLTTGPKQMIVLGFDEPRFTGEIEAEVLVAAEEPAG